MKRQGSFDIIFDGGLCLFCGHFAIKAINLNDQLRWLCTAFTEGIPSEIADGKFDHRKPHPDDNGILFEIKDGYTLPDWVDEDSQRFANEEGDEAE